MVAVLSLLRAILPPAVAASETFTDAPGVELFPTEEEAMARAADRRRREFATVRRCARQALVEIGVEPAPILPGESRAPQWPPGVVGSMTHCEGYRGAAVARASDMHTVGIDAEPHEPLPPGVLRRVALEEELAELAVLEARGEGVHWDRLLFACKETVYKAWFPLAGRWLGFHDARLTLDPDAGTFEARLLVPGPVVGGAELRGLPGRWVLEEGLVVAAVALATG